MKLTRILQESVQRCIDRFPAPTAFATALAVYLTYNILTEQLPDRLAGTIGYFLSVGFVLSLTLALWSEERPGSRRVQRIHFAAYALLIADTLYLYHTNFGTDGHGYETFLMHASAILALALTVFFGSFTREKDDIPSWNFALRLVVSLVVCGLIGTMLWSGLRLLMGSLQWLFNINLGWKWHAVMAVLIDLLLPLLLFLGRIPADARKHDREPLRSGFLAGVVRYLFVPLEVLYIVVLLVYAVQILVRWQLPDGQVSWLVIASMVGLIGIEFGLYPARKTERRGVDEGIARLLPLVLTPLLLLMTVGIARRFADYGITIARLYLVTLNAWFYAVCLGLFLGRARRIHWIPISFAALFLLTSALPLNYASLTRHTLLREVKRGLTQAGADTLPLDHDRYQALMETLPQEEQNRISAKLDYLESTFSTQTIEPLVTQQQGDINFREYIIRETADSVEVVCDRRYYGNNVYPDNLHIPEGYTELYFSVDCDDYPISLRQNTVEVPVSNDLVSDTVVVSLRALLELDKEMKDVVPLPTKSGASLFYLRRFSLNESLPDDNGSSLSTAELTLSGYLLTRRPAHQEPQENQE